MDSTDITSLPKQPIIENKEKSKIIINPEIKKKIDPELNKKFSIEEEENIAIQMFQELKLKKAKLENFTFIIENLDNIKLKVDEFKELYNQFHVTFLTVPDKIRLELIELNNFIDSMVEKQEKLQVINSSYSTSSFNEKIKEYKVHEIFGPIITNLEVYGEKESNSKSEIFKGSYNGKLIYIKLFGLDYEHDVKDKSTVISYNGLEYEQRIYNYIKERYQNINKMDSDPTINFSNVVVPVYDVFKVKTVDFFEHINNIIKIKGGKHNNKIYYSTKAGINVLHNSIPIHLNIKEFCYFIITEDTQSKKYDDFFLNNILNKNIIISTLFDIFYAIYILNSKFKINHNDLHFSNILIKSKKYKKNYYIDSVFLSRDVDYEILIFDFDYSHFNNIQNLDINKKEHKLVGLENKFNISRDIWIFLFHMHSIIINKVNTIDLMEILDYLNNIIHRIILNSDEQIKTFYYNLAILTKHPSHWYKYCQIPEKIYLSPNCVQPNWPDLSAYNVLKRMLAHSDYSSILTFDNAVAFNKKYQRLYIKYKQKYLMLKKSKVLKDNF